MKKLLLVLAALPILSFAQTGESAAPPPANPAIAPPRRSAPVSASPAPAPPPAAPAAPATPSARPAGAAPADQAGQAGGEARMDGHCVPLQGRFLLAFNKADIVDVLEQASRWTCRNFVYTDDIARGKITPLSKTSVTAEEAYAAFLAALTANNIAIYTSGKYLKLVRIADAKKAPIPLYEDGAQVPALEQPVTKLFRLHYADPDQLRGVLGNFTSPQGADLQSIPPDVLIITDLGLNVLRVEKMIEALDRPGSGELIHFIQVRYAAARDLADKVNQVFQANPAQPGRPARRPIIGGVAPGLTNPAAPAPVPGNPSAAGGAEEFALSKVMADERTNKLVVIADDKSFQRIRDLVEQLDVPTSGEGQIHVLFMKYATAEDLAQTLQALSQGQSAAKRTSTTPSPTPTVPGQPQPAQAAQPQQPGGPTVAALFSGEVKITADKVSNALIVLASGSDFTTIAKLVERLDRPRRQVFVEAVIIEVDLQNENDFGVSMHGVVPYSNSNGTGYIPLASETGRINTLNPSSVVALGGFLTGLVGPTSAELSSVLPGIPSLAVLVQALQTSSNTNVISTPQLLATDNEDAEVTVGQNVPFQAGYNPGVLGSATTTTSSTTSSALGSIIGLGGLNSLYAPIQRQDVQLRLRIKPQITEGDNVRLQIDESTEDIASNNPTLGPTTAKRAVKTNITVKDQTTIVIGGLIQDRTLQSVQKTPILGDIPILGWLFRDTVTTKTKTNLLLFLTPYIIHDQSDYRRIYERKRREQQEFEKLFYGKQTTYEPPIDYNHKTGPYTKLHEEIQAEAQKIENGGPGTPGEREMTPGSRANPPSSNPGSEAPPSSPAPKENPPGGALPQGGETAAPSPPRQ